jgi:hypothetical protein
MLLGHTSTLEIFAATGMLVTGMVVPLDASAVVKNVFGRAIAVVVSLTFIVLLLPWLSLISVLIKLGSPGPVFVRVRRIGSNGKPVTLLTFRTMYVEDLPQDIESFLSAANIDVTCVTRFTTLGRILHKTSLDRLPILWNVLRGDLTLQDIAGGRPMSLEMAMCILSCFVVLALPFTLPFTRFEVTSSTAPKAWSPAPAWTFTDAPGRRPIWVTANDVILAWPVDSFMLVDVLETVRQKDDNVTRVVAANVQVLMVATEDEQVKAQHEGIPLPGNVLLMVTRQDSESITLAESQGQLSLALTSGFQIAPVLTTVEQGPSYIALK